MRLPAILVLLVVATSAQASVCAVPDGQSPEASAKQRWVLDRYVYDALLRRDWEVLVDCNHPDAPERMRLLPGLRSRIVGNGAKSTGESQASHPASHAASHVGQNEHGDGRAEPGALRPETQPEIRAGAFVEVSGNSGLPASIRLAGTAMQFAYHGQPVRVRLSANGAIVRAIARGPHAAELAAVDKPIWGQP